MNKDQIFESAMRILQNPHSSPDARLLAEHAIREMLGTAIPVRQGRTETIKLEATFGPETNAAPGVPVPLWFGLNASELFLH